MKPKVIAFYLPQFHPIEENNKWFGEGFTEWTNVGKAKPLFKGHYQPRVPTNLGYYDLRLPEIREKQADLAKEAGVSAFCYYHYWFGNGREMMELPLDEVIKLGKPDFPFCLCWANHSFYRKNWNPDSKLLSQELLLRQEYGGDEDIISHFNRLLPAFKDKRYFRIENKLVFVIYNSKDIPDFLHFKSIWNSMALNNNLPEFFFIAYTAVKNEIGEAPFIHFDATILSLINNAFLNNDYSKLAKVKHLLKEKIGEVLHRPQMVKKYSDIINFLTDEIESRDNIIPSIVPNWDLSPRRGTGATIFQHSTPEVFKKHVLNALRLVSKKGTERQIIFLKSWNEWGEGNYMEPDLRFGKGYIKALNEALSSNL